MFILEKLEDLNTKTILDHQKDGQTVNNLHWVSWIPLLYIELYKNENRTPKFCRNHSRLRLFVCL